MSVADKTRKEDLICPWSRKLAKMKFPRSTAGAFALGIVAPSVNQVITMIIVSTLVHEVLISLRWANYDREILRFILRLGIFRFLGLLLD